MKKLFAILILVLLSCSNELEWPGMEMMYVELDQPQYYWQVSGNSPQDGYQRYLCSEGPYTVRVIGQTVEVDTGKPLARVVHLRGQYGSEPVELEIKNGTGFRVTITEPDPYAETFRIFLK